MTVMILFVLFISCTLGQVHYQTFTARQKSETCRILYDEAMNKVASAGCTAPNPLPAGTIEPILKKQAYAYQVLSKTENGKLYWLSDSFYFALLFVPTSKDDKVILIDAPPTHGQNLINGIKNITHRPVDIMIYSHYHGDHIGDSLLVTKNWPKLKVVAHATTLSVLQKPDHNLQNATLPSFVFSKRTKVGPFELIDSQGAHTAGNIFIYSKQYRTLMLVDIVFPGWVPYVDFALAEDYARYIVVHDQILKSFDFDYYVGGHLTRIGDKNDVVIAKRYLMDLLTAANNAFAAISEEAVEESLGKNENNPWLFFDVYFDNLIQHCYDELVPKYEKILAGIDIFTSEQCYAMLEHIRLS